jgi:hypothetical protein
MNRATVAGVLAAGLLAWGSPAFAQRPHGTPPGLLKKPGPSGSTVTTTFVRTADGSGTGSPVPRVRSLGVWLDDATAMAPGEGWLTVSLQRWSSPVGTGLDAPVFDVVGGLGPRMHAFASVPYSRTSYTGLPSTGELGTMYVGGKFVIREPDADAIGLAVTPTLEILSPSAAAETGFSRVNAVLPVSAEWRRDRTRVFGSTGVFTRGAFFLSGAVEQTLSDRLVATAALSQAWAIDGDALAEEVGLRTSRTDVSGSVAWIASPQVMLFVSGARTVSTLDADATGHALSFGASMNLYRPGRRTPVKKP